MPFRLCSCGPGPRRPSCSLSRQHRRSARAWGARASSVESGVQVPTLVSPRHGVRWHGARASDRAPAGATSDMRAGDDGPRLAEYNNLIGPFAHLPAPLNLSAQLARILTDPARYMSVNRYDTTRPSSPGAASATHGFSLSQTVPNHSPQTYYDIQTDLLGRHHPRQTPGSVLGGSSSSSLRLRAPQLAAVHLGHTRVCPCLGWRCPTIGSYGSFGTWF